MTTVPDEGTSQLKQAQVIGRLLVVAHQYGSAFGQPAQGAYYHPPSDGEGFCAPLVPLLLTNAPDMRTVLVGGNGPVACGVVIPLVQAQVLSDLRARYYHALQGRKSAATGPCSEACGPCAPGIGFPERRRRGSSAASSRYPSGGAPLAAAAAPGPPGC